MIKVYEEYTSETAIFLRLPSYVTSAVCPSCHAHSELLDILPRHTTLLPNWKTIMVFHIKIIMKMKQKSFIN